MKTSHAVEPWSISETTDRGVYVASNTTIVTLVRGSHLVKAGTPEENAANAERIVDCVNALAGMNPKAVAGLLYVTKGVMTALSYPRGSEAQVRCLEELGQDARAALAKANGGN